MTKKTTETLAVRESVALYEAKTQLSALVERAASGAEIVIMKSGVPMARLMPLEDTRVLRVPGRGAGAWTVAEDFDAPLPADVLADFDGA
jgi:prevent-host-death family protein